MGKKHLLQKVVKCWPNGTTLRTQLRPLVVPTPRQRPPADWHLRRATLTQELEVELLRLEAMAAQAESTVMVTAAAEATAGQTDAESRDAVPTE